jgi:hypothetical protein
MIALDVVWSSAHTTLEIAVASRAVLLAKRTLEVRVVCLNVREKARGKDAQNNK